MQFTTGAIEQGVSGIRPTLPSLMHAGWRTFCSLRACLTAGHLLLFLLTPGCTNLVLQQANKTAENLRSHNMTITVATVRFGWPANECGDGEQFQGYESIATEGTGHGNVKGPP